MKISGYLKTVAVLFSTAAAMPPFVHSVHDETWLPSHSPTEEALTKVVFGAGVFVALAPGEEREESLVVRSGNGVDWEAVEMPKEVHLSDVAFGAGRFVAVGMNLSEPQRTGKLVVLVSGDGADWAPADHFPEPEYRLARVGYTGEQFWIARIGSSVPYVSRRGLVWTEGPSSPHGVPVLFEGKLLLPFGPVILREEQDGQGDLEWEITALGGQVITLVPRKDRVVALVKAFRGEGNDSFAVSGDGQVWASFQQDFSGLNDVIVLTEPRGRFFAVGDGAAFSSVDGARWADRSAGIDHRVLHSAAGGHGVIVAVGEVGMILHRSTNLPPVILNQPQQAREVPQGQPLLLAIEAEETEDLSITWHKDGRPIAGAHSSTLEIAEVEPDDAGRYTATIANDVGIVTSSPAEVTVTAKAEKTIAWEEVASFGGDGMDVDLSRLAEGNGRMFALGDDRRSSHVQSSFPSAWSANGEHWRRADLILRENEWRGVGFTSGRFWIAGFQSRIAFSEDGIAWRLVSTGGGRASLVGEHEGRLFAPSENDVLTSQHGEHWSVMAEMPVPRAGGYLSEGDRLLVSNVNGIVEWNGQVVREVLLDTGGPYSRLVRERGVTTHVGPRYLASPLYRSVDLENWTKILGALAGARGVTGHNGEFFAVGSSMRSGAFLQTSTDGLRWAERSGRPSGLAGTGAPNACAVAGHFLYAVSSKTASSGDTISHILQRPAAMEPAFYQQPVGMRVASNEPVRLIGRATGAGEIDYQWYLNRDPIDGATGPVLEIEAFNDSDDGVYYVVATNDIGSVSSDHVAVLVGSDEVGIHWHKLADIDPGEEAAFQPSTLANGNGRMVAVSPEGDLFSISEDGRSWLHIRPARPRPLELSEALVFAGERFFADSSEGVIVSKGGVTWTVEPSLQLLDGLRDVAFGDGIYVAVTENGVYRAEDLDAWKRVSTRSDVLRVAYGHNRFVVSGRTGQIWVSDDGHSWTSAGPDLVSEQAPMQELVYGNGYFLLSVGFTRRALYRSPDAHQWEEVPTDDFTTHLSFAGGNFWRNGTSVSSDGKRWVDRSNQIGAGPVHVAHADEIDIIAVTPNAAYRHPAKLNPVLHGERVVQNKLFRGQDLVLQAPEVHGTPPFTYRWVRDGVTVATGQTLPITDADETVGAVYTVFVSNTYGEASRLFPVWFVDSFEIWSKAFRHDGEIREMADDPHNLGIPNLLRYALHLDPQSPERSRLPQLSVVEDAGARYTALQFRLLDGMDDVEWSVEGSADLDEWEPLTSQVLLQNEQDRHLRRITVRDTKPLGENERRFLRLNVEPVEP